MKRQALRRFAAATVWLGLWLCLSTPAAAQSPNPCPDAGVRLESGAVEKVRSAVLCIVNFERTSRGLPTLAVDPRLQAAAQKHSDDMAARGYFDHQSPEGRDPGDRIDAEGYPWATYGENIAGGYTTARDVMEGWMSSDGHCSNILSPSFVDLGVGISVQGALWTQNFGRQLNVQEPSTNGAPQDSCPEALNNTYGPDPVLCQQAKDKLRRAKAKLRKLKRQDAGERAIARAKARVREVRKAVREACSE